MNMDQERYQRQLILPQIGKEGQRKLAASHVLVVGLGGLGSAAAWFLAAAGSGRLTLLDPDTIAPSNLQRQLLYKEADLGRPKAAAAKTALQALSSGLKIKAIAQSFEDIYRPGWLKQFDFVIEATDQPETKFAVNDRCVEEKKPFSYAGVKGFEGVSLTYVPGSASLRQAFPNLRATNKSPQTGPNPILGPVAGLFGCLQATEAIKYLVGIQGLLTNRIMRFDLQAMQVQTIKISPSFGRSPQSGHVVEMTVE